MSQHDLTKLDQQAKQRAHYRLFHLNTEGYHVSLFAY